MPFVGEYFFVEDDFIKLDGLWSGFYLWLESGKSGVVVWFFGDFWD